LGGTWLEVLVAAALSVMRFRACFASQLSSWCGLPRVFRTLWLA
jgi:hypothetical protein